MESVIKIGIPQQSVIDPDDVIAWLVNQPNANGTLYLENVVRQYISVIRSAPAKLQIPVGLDVRNVFTCHTPTELIAYWDIFKAAPNYKQLNASTSGMFSAGMGCYLRYLEHIASVVPSTKEVDESDKPQETHPSRTEVEISEKSVQRVDFSRPELCTQTRPLTCTIRGQVVIPKKQKWSQLLVAITERFVQEENPNLTSLDHNPLYGSMIFFRPHKSDFSNCAQLAQISNGKWIYTKYNSQTIVTIIRNLCQHCNVDLDDVIITYELIGGAPIRMSQAFMHSNYIAATAPPKPVLDPAIIEQCMNVLSEHFSNGYRLNSPIELVRFRSFTAEVLGKEISLLDEELKNHIADCGTIFDGKVYAVSTQSKERIKELVKEYFAEGAHVIFFAEFYAKNENWLFKASIVSEKMLICIFHQIFPKLSYTQTYFGYTNATVSAALESEILRVWGGDILLDYEQLTDRLKYIPFDRIKNALGQNGEFIWNNVGTFSHVSRIYITDEEREAIREAAVRDCNACGYALIKDLPFGEIKERNYELSITAVHNAVYRICLSDRFDKKGKIVTRKGDVFDALTIMKEYCRTIDKCSLNGLLNFERELTGEVHRWIPMEAGNTILVRIDKDTYVADRYVRFNVDVIDEAIGLFVKGDYLPLKSFTTFGVFPDCGQTWNLFLLESYCRRFSRKFRFDTPSVNSRNAGTVIRKSSGLDYIEIMTDAVANANILLNDNVVGKFLYASGYTGRSTTAKVGEIIEKAKALREKRE